MAPNGNLFDFLIPTKVAHAVVPIHPDGTFPSKTLTLVFKIRDCRVYGNIAGERGLFNAEWTTALVSGKENMAPLHFKSARARILTS